jgi:hypothetical protein
LAKTAGSVVSCPMRGGIWPLIRPRLRENYLAPTTGINGLEPLGARRSIRRAVSRDGASTARHHARGSTNARAAWSRSSASMTSLCDASASCAQRSGRGTQATTGIPVGKRVVDYSCQTDGVVGGLPCELQA